MRSSTIAKNYAEALLELAQRAKDLRGWGTQLEGIADATETPIGNVPTAASLDLDGLELTDDQLRILLTVDPEVWREEAALIPQHYERFGDRLFCRRIRKCSQRFIPKSELLWMN